jgi:hypothetical protein
MIAHLVIWSAITTTSATNAQATKRAFVDFLVSSIFDQSIG